MKYALPLLLIGLALPVWGQINITFSNSDKPDLDANKNIVSIKTNVDLSHGQHAEQVRNACILGRRSICGKILRVLPGGLVVESGYTDLLRPELSKTWLVPGNAIAHRTANLIESAEAGSPCVGVVYLRDLPKIRGSGSRPKQYDYVVLLGYSAGEHTYTSVGDIHKTVRQFSANLIKAVDLKLEAETESGTSAAVVK